jgi:hypothetical protein
MELGRLADELGGDAYGLAIGERGEIVSAGPVLWRDGKSRRVAMPAGWTSVGAIDVNGRGEIVGEGELQFARRAFLWDAGRVTDLGRGTQATAINEAGQVVGGAAFAGPAAGPAMAQLEPAGLYVAAGRTLTFSPRSAVRQRLGG